MCWQYPPPPLKVMVSLKVAPLHEVVFFQVVENTPFPCFSKLRVITAVTHPRIQPSTTFKNIPFIKPFLNHPIWNVSWFPAGTLADRHEGSQYTCFIPHHILSCWDKAWQGHIVIV